ncbi:uncharacterized protein LOC110999954 isoform X2 [Pieris rapae]|uniref:uncharacterized protein LOC110999954 isoform X2 n=1 Tax=Pieris rapae TaxID=64459 RepID=UPI001E27A639|nr:uncharacterized protein LOC110999954 isoform X2 [Pieris rapae]
MASNDFNKKIREDREARVQARIQKLRELNLKKYGQSETNRNNTPRSASENAVCPKNKPNFINNLKSDKNLNSLKKPTTISNVLPKKTEYPSGIPKKTQPHIKNIVKDLKKPEAKDIQTNINGVVKKDIKSNQKHVNWDIKKAETNNLDRNKIVRLPLNGSIKAKENANLRKSVIPTKPPLNNRKSFIPTNTAVAKKSTTTTKIESTLGKRESVFERLYKPKTVYTEHNIKHHIKPIAPPIVNRRNTTFDQSQRAKPPVRRSISAVHFKKIDKGQLKNCIHRWASIGEKINKVSLHNINEDENIQEMVSAVKSEQKKVKFQTPMTNPDEMRLKLVKWLEKRGKTIDTYQHLHCFGIQRAFDIPKFDYGDEDKENQPLENDSDNESFTELNGQLINKWRSPSNMDSVEFNESYETAIISDPSPMVDDALLGALKDLTDILRHGYSWEEGARWLRAIRDTYSDAQETATYWECRAALEEARGDMPASMQCWEQALAKGTNRTVAEENIDQLLAKFMQLKINPGSEKKVDPKLVDAKNVFKSTLLRFAVQENKFPIKHIPWYGEHLCQKAVTPSSTNGLYKKKTTFQRKQAINV